ncbi:hypothetical protein JOM56_014705 [Amanita muscaria]
MIGSAWPGSSMRSGGEQRQVDQFGGGVLALESGRVGAAGNQFSNIAEAATVPEPINTARETPAPLGQPPPQPAQPGYSTLLDVAQHLQQSDFQAPYNLQWMVSQPPLPPLPEQSAFNTNYDYGSQWHGQQQQYQQYQQHQYHALPSIAQYPYQPQATADHTQHYFPHPVASPQQQQQPQRLQRTPPPQDLRLAKRQRSDGPNLNRQAHHHAHLPPRPQFQPFPFQAQNAGVYPDQNQGSGLRDGSYMDSGDEGNFGGAASIQAEGHNIIPISAGRAAVSVATQLHGAHVNNYGGTHGLENLKEFVSFAALHDSSAQDPDRRCHPGTRKTVLIRLRDWFDNPNATDRIVWLHGPAGAGKSAIAQIIADEYKERGVDATFFFYRSDASRNNGNRLFPTIAWQLAFSIPPTKNFIVRALDETPHLPTQAVETQFEQLVAHPFQPTNNIATQMSQPAPVVIIDGVDECSDEKLQRRILAVIGNAVKNHRVPLRFLIVSRPEALIEKTLNKFKDFTVSIDLATLDDSNRDIQKYLEDKFSEIASNRGLDPTWPGQKIIEEIVFKSSGNFVFPSLVIRFINDEDCDPEVLLNIVRNLAPRGNMSPFALLDELFLEILKRQRDQNFLKTFLALFIGRSSIRPTH